jgi:Ca2+-binding RTX toxin-like protein
LAYTLTNVSNIHIDIEFVVDPDWVGVWADPANIFANADVITGSNLADHINAYGGDDKVYGKGGNDWIDGGAGNDAIDGGLGADQMSGGIGNDLYLVDNPGDLVAENADEGVDEIKSTTPIASLVANVENYTYGGLLAWTFAADGADNRLSGGAGKDALDGGAGNDALLGNGGADLLIGGVGNDHLDGGVGNDTMKGGAGNDIYVIGGLGDLIDEGDNFDTDDLVRSSISVNLAVLAGGRIEHATLTGIGAINALGNAADNILTGNDAANILDGKAGADTMIGNRGNDTYFVDDAGDQVSETTAGSLGGTDLVKSWVGFALGANLEKLTLLGTGDIDATGNGLANVLTGNSGDNRLDGRGGNDTMYGGAGSDTYVVNAIGDVVGETVANSSGGGLDTIESSVTYSIAARPYVEHITLMGSGNVNATGNALGNILAGNGGNNILSGGSGNDTLTGGAGNDSLVGGLGNDLLVGGAGSDTMNGGAGRDVFDYDALSDAGDTIVGFALGATGDVLDLRDLLEDIGYAGSDAVDEGYILFAKVGTGTVVSVDVDGALGASTPITLATLTGITLTAAHLDNYLA